MDDATAIEPAGGRFVVPGSNAAPQSPDDSVDLTFSVGAATYRLRAAAGWSANRDEDLIRPEQARSIIAEALLQRHDDALKSLLNTAGARLEPSRDQDGLVLVRLRPRRPAGGAGDSAPSFAQPAPRPQRPPSPAPPPSVEAPLVPAEAAAAQAATLKKAAELGVPFCEECARAAARQAAAGIA